MPDQKETGRIDYTERSNYNNNVFVGNWFEERSRYVKQRHHHITTVQQDYYPKPTSRIDPDIMWDRVFQGSGIGGRLLFEHDGDNYQKNFSTTSDLSYNHLVRWYSQSPSTRQYRFRMGRWEPEQDLTRNFGPITKFGIVAQKEQLWEEQNSDPRQTLTTEYQDSYIPPEEDSRHFKRFAIPIENSSILNSNNTAGVQLQLRNKPMFNVTPNEDLVVMAREPRCNPITWECFDNKSMGATPRCVEQ